MASKLTVVYGGGDTGASGVYDADGDMVVSARMIEHVGYDWHRFAGASDAEVQRWTAEIRRRWSEISSKETN